jgi:hypothetical protein
MEKHSFEVVDTYMPSRYMTVRHAVDWGVRFLPESIRNYLYVLFEKANLDERILTINLGDIVTVIARKE